MPLPRILFETYLATFSGLLRLARQGVKRTIYLWGGLPVRVETEQESPLLHLLVDHGRLTEEQTQQVRDFAQSHGLPEGKALVEAGLLRQAELLDAMRELTEEQVVNCFVWRDGTYSIEPDTTFGETVALTEVHPVQCILRGVSEHYDLVSLLTYFGPLRERYAVATELFAVHYESLGPMLRYLDLGPLLNGKTTFEEALRSDDTRAVEVARVLYVLLVTDMIRPSAKPGAAAVIPERQKSQQPHSRLIDYREITRLCDDVAREYLRLKESDYFAALGVGHEATPVEVEQAYEKVAPRFAPDALPPGLPDDVTRRAQEVATLLARARQTLRDPELKRRYLERPT